MSAAPAQHDDARTQTGMIPALDLAAYFARIGYHGEQTPVLPTLASLLDAHMILGAYALTSGTVGRAAM